MFADSKSGSIFNLVEISTYGMHDMLDCRHVLEMGFFAVIG